MTGPKKPDGSHREIPDDSPELELYLSSEGVGLPVLPARSNALRPRIEDTYRHSAPEDRVAYIRCAEVPRLHILNRSVWRPDQAHILISDSRKQLEETSDADK